MLQLVQQRWNPSSAWAGNRRAKNTKTTFYNWCRKGTRTIGKPRATWNISNKTWFNWWGWPKNIQRARVLPDAEAKTTGAGRRPGWLIGNVVGNDDKWFFNNAFCNTFHAFDSGVIFDLCSIVSIVKYLFLGRRGGRRPKMASKIPRGLCRKPVFGARFVLWAAMDCWVSQNL